MLYFFILLNDSYSFHIHAHHMYAHPHGTRKVQNRLMASRKDGCSGDCLQVIFSGLCIRLLFLKLLIKPVTVLTILFDIIQCLVRSHIIFFKVSSLSAHAQTAGQGCR